MVLNTLAIVLTSAISISLTGFPFQGSQDVVTHWVNFGETLSSLAQLSGVNEVQLAQMNYLTRGDILQVGEPIVLPQHPQEPFLLYRVSRGDTLLGIAARYAISP